jgi:8-oxo-dGTP pyrophosphatase MutT (NUDIX family)
MQVFVDDKVIRFVTHAENAPFEQVVDLKTSKDIDLWKVFSEFVRHPDKTQLSLLSDDPGRMMRKFAGFFLPMDAAGGVVKNPEGKLLVIYRMDKWDLPKGKVDPGEVPTETAIREVREECGINLLQITADLGFTLHVYPWKGEQWILKKTYWFEMRSQSDEKLIPQEEEGIEQVKWAGPEDLPGLLKGTYASLRKIIRQALKSG